MYGCVKNVDLMDVLDTPKIRVELEALEDIFTNHLASTDPGKKLHMWKYARIFNPNFYTSIQTKNCVFFTLVLAWIPKIRAPQQNSDVMKIAHLEKASLEQKLQAKAMAMRALQVLDKTTFEGPFAGIENIN